jgi:hypothetical protein
MLKRNGQNCHRTVPDYLGRLTDFEFLAYCAVFESLADDYGRVSSLNSALTELERSLPRLADACAAPKKHCPEIVPASEGPNWEMVGTLLKLDRTAMLLCRREVGGKREFSIIEHLDQNAPLARAKGVWHVQMTSNDAKVMLQDFVEGERQALKLYANDIVASARETVDQKYPGQNLGRVVKAISQRCTKATSPHPTAENRSGQKNAAGVRV